MAHKQRGGRHKACRLFQKENLKSFLFLSGRDDFGCSVNNCIGGHHSGPLGNAVRGAATPIGVSLKDQVLTGTALALNVHNRGGVVEVYLADIAVDQGTVSVEIEGSDGDLVCTLKKTEMEGRDRMSKYAMLCDCREIALHISENLAGLSHIFERFYKCSHDFNESGSGLGLAIAEKIADGLRKKIWAESELGVTPHPAEKAISKKIKII